MRRKVHQHWKVVVIGFLMFVHIIEGLATLVLLYGKARRDHQLKMLQRNSRMMLAVLGIQLELEDEANWRVGQNYLIVSNHLGYLDMVLFAAFRPVVFVSTVEVQQTPVLGQIAAGSGAIFVERRSRENIRNEVAAIGDALKQGYSSVFFPEGTSTDGHHVLPFKRSLFAPAQHALVPVLPVVVQLLEVDGQRASAANRDFVAYYGDMQFFPHLLSLAGCSRVRMKLKILPEIPVTPESKRDELAAKAEAAIRENYQPIV